MTLDSASITGSDSVKSLGATIDETLSVYTNVNNVCKASYFHIMQGIVTYKRMHPRGDFTNGGQLIIVGDRLNYCNSVLHGTTISDINKIQRVINMLARLVTGTGKRDHITPVLEKLHWLPVQSRITFKFALITYETLL